MKTNSKTLITCLTLALLAPIQVAVGAPLTEQNDTEISEEGILLAEQLDAAGFGNLEEGTIIVSAPLLVEEGGVDSFEVIEDQASPGEKYSLQSAGSVVAGNAIDLANIATCLGKPKLVREKIKSKHDGVVKFECGAPKSHGLNHILDSHPLPQWRNQMGGNDGSVVQYIDFIVRASLSAPEKASHNKTRNTRCYTTPIQVYKMVGKRQKLIKTIYPSTYVSVNNKRIVTSVPSTKSKC